MASEQDTLLQEQVAYYRARAQEYDQWFLRQGRYDRGEEHKQQWFAEVEHVRHALADLNPQGRVLEFACGTGLWTERLIEYADHVTALDSSPEVLAINKARVQSDRVDYQQMDIFSWTPKTPYDAVFFGFWLSHVPPERFDDFWSRVALALKPDGRVFFVDSRYEIASTAKDHVLEGEQATTMTRRLNDGREFRIVKIFYKPDDLSSQLADLGWRFDIRETDNFFVYGNGEKG